jgi:hypothetical protein
MRSEPRDDQTNALSGVYVPGSLGGSSSEDERERWWRRAVESRVPLPETPPRVSRPWCPDMDQEIRKRRREFSERMGFTPPQNKGRNMKWLALAIVFAITLLIAGCLVGAVAMFWEAL